MGSALRRRAAETADRSFSADMLLYAMGHARRDRFVWHASDLKVGGERA
jgi:hypothetical protein